MHHQKPSHPSYYSSSSSSSPLSFSLLPSTTLLLLSLLLTLLFSDPTLAQQVRQTSTEYTNDDAFRESILNVTNTYRKEHNATGLEWNETLAEFAGEWGEGCRFEHSGGPYGENLASGYPNASASVITWGEEREQYNFAGGDFSPETGHFTQLVWKNTTQVGCSRTECNAGGQSGDDDDEGDAPGWFVVCEYAPAGNVIGAFVENVQERVEGSGEECVQGAVCSGVEGQRRSMVVLGVALVVGCVGGAWV
ncbi:Nn.00g096580.m01.CDS01 [Neocucurbitaria sp. VM-36]